MAIQLLAWPVDLSQLGQALPPSPLVGLLARRRFSWAVTFPGNSQVFLAAGGWKQATGPAYTRAGADTRRGDQGWGSPGDRLRTFCPARGHSVVSKVEAPTGTGQFGLSGRCHCQVVGPSFPGIRYLLSPKVIPEDASRNVTRWHIALK